MADGGRGMVVAVSPTENAGLLRYLDPGNGLVRRIAADGTTSTLAGVRA